MYIRTQQQCILFFVVLLFVIFFFFIPLFTFCRRCCCYYYYYSLANTVCVCKTHDRRRRAVDIDWERRDPVMREKSDLGPSLSPRGHRSRRRGRGHTRAHVKAPSQKIIRIYKHCCDITTCRWR